MCFLGLACATSNNFRKDVILCEEAVVQLRDCCPGFDDISPDACEYFEGCSGSRATLLNVTTSECIRDKECAELVDQGICDRAHLQLVLAPVDESSSTRNTVQVCP